MHCPTLEELPLPPVGKAGWPWTEDSRSLLGTRLNSSSFPCVSIVTPSYNQGEFLEETIRSVLLQGYPNLEYIIIDGGSTDNSVEIIKKYQNYLSYWVSEPDKGPADAINKGWQKTRAEIIAYLNSDDAYLPGTLAAVAEAFQQNPEAKAICGNELVIDRDGFVIRKSNIEKVEHSSLLKLNLIPQPAIFLKSSILKSVGGMNLEVRYIFDFELWLRITRTDSMKCIPNLLAVTRWHEQTITHTQRPAIGSEIVDILTKETNNFAAYLTPAEKKYILFICNRLALNLHFEGKKIFKSLQYAARMFSIYPSFGLSFELLSKYANYLLFGKTVESLEPIESFRIHWSSFFFNH
jgi:glycosyltransferase involved in cell wall biosynthesis